MRRDQLIHFWNTDDFSRLNSVAAMEAIEGAVALIPSSGVPNRFAEGGPFFITAGKSGVLRTWDAASGECVHKKTNGLARNADALKCDGDIQTVATQMGFTHLISYGDNRVLAVTRDHNMVVYVASTLDLCRRVHCSSMACVLIHCAHCMRALTVLARLDMTWYRCVAGNNDEITDIRCIRGGAICAGSNSANVPAMAGMSEGNVGGAKRSEDRIRLAVATNSAHIKLFDCLDMDCALLFGHTDVVLALDISASSDLLASASKDGSARVWSTADGACVALCEGHVGAVGAVAFASHGDFLLTGSKDTMAKLWDIGECVRSRIGPAAGCTRNAQKDTITSRLRCAHAKAVRACTNIQKPAAVLLPPEMPTSILACCITC